MANTYTQLNVHAVFSVKGRGNFITKKITPSLRDLGCDDIADATTTPYRWYFFVGKI